MKTKTCNVCQETKPIIEFYKHAAMGDGHLNKCKSCVCLRVHKYRVNNDEQVRLHDSIRAQDPKRKADRLARAKLPEHKARHAVRNKTRRLILTGALIPEPCKICGNTKVEAHHHDYSKPLEVEWLCALHHRRLHHSKHYEKPLSSDPRKQCREAGCKTLR